MPTRAYARASYNAGPYKTVDGALRKAVDLAVQTGRPMAIVRKVSGAGPYYTVETHDEQWNAVYVVQVMPGPSHLPNRT